MSPAKLEQESEIIAQAVGFVVINWAVAEQSLDLVVSLIWHNFDGANYQKNIPVLLKPKIEFVKKCIAGNSVLVDLKCECDGLLDEFGRLGDIRNDLIHSAARSFSAIDGSFVFNKLDVCNGFHHCREVKLQVNEYPKLVDELISLGQQAHRFAEMLLGRAKPV